MPEEVNRVLKHVEEYITHEGGQWVVHSDSGKVLGRHDTEAEANHRLAMVEAHKGNGSQQRDT